MLSSTYQLDFAFGGLRRPHGSQSPFTLMRNSSNLGAHGIVSAAGLANLHCYEQSEPGQ